MAKATKKQALGRGLSALLKDPDNDIKTAKDKNERYEQSAEKISQEKEMFSSLEDDVGKVLENFNFVKLYKGWIPDRFEEVSGKRFSFAHIDVDLCEPTRDSLEFFFHVWLKGEASL